MLKRIINQMNNNRLSTSKGPTIDRNELLLEIEKFLSRPSNYEIKAGKVWIKYLKKSRLDTKPIAVQLIEASSGNIINTFSSIVQCAKYLDLAYATVHKRISTEKHLMLNGKLVYIVNKKKEL